MPPINKGSTTTTRRRLLAGIGGYSLLTLAGCLGDDDDGEETPTPTPDPGGPTPTPSDPGEDQYGGTLVYSSSESVQQLHPHYRIAIVDTQLAVHIVEALFILDDELLPEPRLVEDWDVTNDGTTYVFEIPEGVMFHPPVSRELVADDIVASLEQVQQDPGAVAHEDMSPVTSIEAIDDYSVELNLENAYPALINSVLTRTDSAILPEEHLEDETHPVGTGPFKFEEWERGNFARLSKFDDYREEGVPYFDEIVTNPVSEDSVRLDELMVGDSDVIINAPTSEVDLIENDDSVGLVEYDGFVAEFTGFNVEREPFDDPRVRQAIDFAIDKTAAVEFALDGYGTPAVTPLPSFHAFAIDDEPRPQDFDQAQSLLEDAGYGDGFEFEFLLPEVYTPSVEFGTPVESWLGEIGVDVNLRVTTWDNVLTRAFVEGDYDVTTMPFLGTHATPFGAFNKILHSSGSLNFMNYASEEMDGILDEAARTVDEGARRDLYLDAQELYREEVPLINPFYWSQLYGHRNTVQGQLVHGESELRLWHNWFSDQG